jgi:hypothetical protein
MRAKLLKDRIRPAISKRRTKLGPVEALIILLAKLRHYYHQALLDRLALSLQDETSEAAVVPMHIGARFSAIVRRFGSGK